MKSKWLTVALVCSLILTGVSPMTALADEGDQTESAESEETGETQTEDVEYEIIPISTAQDLLDLADQCHEDSWSVNKIAELQNDINLTGFSFTSIPIWNGIFRGNGNSISGYEYGGGGYVTGFFRYVGDKGLVQDLNLAGSITAVGDQQITGTIAGINQGEIRDCTFTGTVSGKSETGGIVGINQPGGLIYRCTNTGRVSGYYYTGGIVGKNCSYVIQCTNSGNVNDSDKWVAEDDEMTADILSALKNVDRASLQSGTDTGGIAGYSMGTMSRCVNEGTVGYPHVGYNVGGIAGRSSGIVKSCTNTGKVYGKRDVGGILGQSEPYIETNQAESVRSSVETLNDLITQAADDAEHASAVIQSDLRRLQRASESTLDKATEISKSAADKAAFTKPELSTDKLQQLAKDGADLQELGVDPEKLKADAEKLKDQAAEDAENAEERARQLEQDVQNGTLGNNVTADQEQVKSDYEALTAQMKSLNSALSTLNSHADSLTSELRSDVSAVNDQVDTTYTLVTDIVNGVKEEGVTYLFKDVSEQALNLAPMGLVMTCTNTGWIKADSDCGGIVGRMGIDEDNVENNVVILMKPDAGETYTITNVVMDCKNDGFVEGRTDNVGGIAGRMDHGLVTGSFGYGSVSSEGGSYLGGIAGYSEGTIADSFVLSQLSGNHYLGGITGYGKAIRGCVSMPVIEAYSGTCGAVAGQVVRDENTEEMDTLEVRGNCYVSDAFYGIDDISYQGTAEAISYEDLLARENTPGAYSHLKVTFVADETVLETREVSFGDALEELELPDVPEVKGKYYRWEDLSGRTVVGNMVVRAEYLAEIPTVESTQQDPDTGKAVGYVSGSFGESTVLSVEKSGDPFVPTDGHKYKSAHVYDITLSGEEIGEHEEYTLRLLLPCEKYSVWEKEGEFWQQVSFENRGSYTEVSAKGNSVKFAIVEEPDYTLLYILLGVCAAAFLLMLILQLKLRFSKNQ